jgi:hypothetical protein
MALLFFTLFNLKSRNLRIDWCSHFVSKFINLGFRLISKNLKGEFFIDAFLLPSIQV